MPRPGPGPALTVDAVWIRGGRILLVRRGRPPFLGKWALPGGFVEGTERLEEAVLRELQEETALSGRVRGIVGVYSGPERDPRRPTATVAFEIVGRGGVPRGGDDARAARWVPVGDALGLAFDHDAIVADARRLLRRRSGRRRLKRR